MNMHTDPQLLDVPTDDATLERAISLASECCYAVALQVRRLRSKEPEDAVFILGL
jgi:hypothetical protein